MTHEKSEFSTHFPTEAQNSRFYTGSRSLIQFAPQVEPISFDKATVKKPKIRVEENIAAIKPTNTGVPSQIQRIPTQELHLAIRTRLLSLETRMKH